MVKPPPAGPPAPPRSQGGAWLPVGHRIGRTSTPNSGRSEKLRRDVFTCDGHPRLLRQPHRLERFLCVSSLKERGWSIPTKKIVSVLCAVPSVQAAAVSPPTGSGWSARSAARTNDLGAVAEDQGKLPGPDH